MRLRCARISPSGASSRALAVAFIAFFPRAAEADPLPTNDYSVDVFQGPVLAPLRITALGGAFSGVAEGIPAFVSNAAAPSVRQSHSVSHVDWDIAGSLSIPLNLFDNNDFDNSGDVDFDYSNFVYASLGGQVQVGPVGFGLLSELQNYALTSEDDASVSTNVLLGKHHVLGAVSTLDGQLHFGAGVRIATMSIDVPSVTLVLAGLAPELGVLVRPNGRAFRAGATFRFPVEGQPFTSRGLSTETGFDRVGPFALPKSLVLPWEIELGFAIQAGRRAFNPPWRDPGEEEDAIEALVETAKRERAFRAGTEPEALREALDEAFEESDRLEANAAHRRRQDAARETQKSWPRDRLLFTFDLLMTGPVDEGVSVERFLAQALRDGPTRATIGSSGADVNFSPRLGFEAEPIANWFVTRVGTYYEPNRFNRIGRQHFTFGAELKMFSTTFWDLIPETFYAVTAACDFAPRYQSVSAGISVWH
jgi:hypothetical protein